MKINWRVRFRNPVFWAQIALAVLTPILAYLGITADALTSWSYLGQVLMEAVKNPYVLALVVVSVWNSVNDPTTSGLSDSDRAMTYETPKQD